MNQPRLNQQISFIIEIDKLKDIFRQTFLMNGKRKENDAEHSWHIALMAVLLSEYATEKKLCIFRTVEMLLIHDLVEIDAGDTYVYDEDQIKDKREREMCAAERIFNLLPEDQAKAFRDLWEEYEEQKTPESKFALSLDVLQPLLHNYKTKGKAWKQHKVTSKLVMERANQIKEGSSILWGHAKKIISDAVKKGYLRK
ncbi:MAG: HD domain-containing protein [Spirochaetota bacterium]|nr:MAG: HD domain-containing protein [Spirochaetota bacterium]